ncbi:MAG: right-handed parallel beta-helix repeat-containing protein [Bacteroides sp.]|nr:right-handed parallel beta-helix repeat-containing protein [Bacteroides sp.]
MIKISQWFVSGVYEVDKVDDGYVYFSTDYPFVSNRKNWNVNYDLKYGKTMPRFRVFKTSPDETLMKHESTCFIRVQNSSFESLIITDLNFRGSAQSQKGIILLVNTKTKLTDISRCSFKECKSPCIALTDASNVLIKDCSFTDNYNNCIGTDNQCVNTRIINNCFKNNDRDWYNHFDIRVSGDGFLVADNTIVNSPYGAIRVGDWWRSQNIRRVKGIVENNLIYYTPDFYNDYWKHTLMDSGAIYVNTINDDVHIRYNRIYDIAGMKDYRGIFGDDGTCNSKIYGNVITGIKDSYSIDLRATPKVEENPQYKFGKVNVDNILMYNVVDGDIRFQGRVGENGCMKGPDFLLQSKDHKGPELNIRNIYDQEDDIPLDLKRTNNGCIVLSRPDKDKLRQNPIYRKIAKWIK